MALTVTQLAAALRVGNGTDAPPEPINGILTRLEGAARAMVKKLCKDAPEAVVDEATIRVVGYLFDAPPQDGTRYAHAIRNSGALSLISPWCPRDAVAVGDDS